MIRFGILGVFVLLFGLGAIVSPLPDRRVHDFASILSPEVEGRIEQALFAVERETTAQVAVVTIGSLDGISIEEYALTLFNQWGIGQSDTNNGVLFLIAPSERRTRIEVGHGLESLITDGLAGEILDTNVIPHFKQGNFPEGIEQGALAIVDLLQRYPDAARGIPGSAPVLVFTKGRTAQMLAFAALGSAILLFVFTWWGGRQRRYSPVLFFIGIGAVAILAGAFVLFSTQLSGDSIPWGSGGSALGLGILSVFRSISRYRRFRPHHCGECGTEMELLSEAEDDARLSKEQKLEESLGSVDYDVWVCPACLKQHTEEYKAFLSSFGDCPKCKRRTFKENATTIIAPTYASTGLRRLDGECRNCWHKTTREEVIPRLQRSSGSSSSGRSSGGFGGGRSGGGGASRGW